MINNNRYLSPDCVGAVPSAQKRAKKMRSYRGVQMVSRVSIQVILTVLAFIWILPLAYIIVHSFRINNPSTIFPTDIFPEVWGFDNYAKLLGGSPEMYSNDKFGWINFPRWWLNTLGVSIVSCLISTFYVLATSYAFSRMRFKMRQPMMRIVLILGMFPGFLGMVAVYNILSALGLNEDFMKLVALVLVYSGGAGMGYYIAKGFFDTIPRALDESARIDGANRAQVFWKIILPSSKPIIVYTILTAFMAPWMDFIFVKLICMGDADFFTVSLGLWTMLSTENFSSHWLLFCAGATLVATPITALFMFLQRFYVSGVTGGAVKG